MKIEILGTGCAKCEALTANAKAAVEQLGLTDCEVAKVTEFNEIAKRGVLVTPALVVDGKVKLIGTSGSTEQVATLLAKQ